MTKRKQPDWILSDDDYWFNDWSYEYFQEVGITCHEQAFWSFFYARFESEKEMDCPHCGCVSEHYTLSEINKGSFKCKKCRKRFSITSGTHLSDSKLPLEYWYRICFLITNLKFPINSRALSKSLGLTQSTVYYMLMTIKDSLGIENPTTGGVGGQGNSFLIPEDIDNWWKLKSYLVKLKNIHK